MKKNFVILTIVVFIILFLFLIRHKIENFVIEQAKKNNEENSEHPLKNNWAEGYTYMPPLFIKNMQEQPKNCIIDPYKLNGPVAVFTDGAPVNALEYTKVGSMLPPFKYTEYSFDEKKKVEEAMYPKVNMLQGYEAKTYSKYD